MMRAARPYPTLSRRGSRRRPVLVRDDDPAAPKPCRDQYRPVLGVDRCLSAPLSDGSMSLLARGSSMMNPASNDAYAVPAADRTIRETAH